MAKHVLALGALAAALLLAACGSTPASTPTPTEPAVTLTGNTWVADDLNGTPVITGAAITATFGEDGTISGSGGCNRYSGTFTLDGAKLTVAESLVSTMMHCGDEIMTQEGAYFEALKAARSFAIDGQRLVLSGESGTALASFTRQAQELAGTDWKLVGFNDGSAAVSPLLDTELTISFAADGTVSGSSGCNTFTGAFTAAEGTLKIGPLASTMMACEAPDGVMDQEAKVVAALESAATYSVEAATLNVRTSDDAIAFTAVQG